MLKKELLAQAKAALDAKLRVAYNAMQAAQAAANEENKSSAGDKYETARAMGQIERDMHAQQFEKIKQERELLERIDFQRISNKVVVGSLVKTSDGLFWIAVGLGIMTIENQYVTVLSAVSPVGKLLMGKTVNDSFVFREKNYTILAIL